MVFYNIKIVGFCDFVEVFVLEEWFILMMVTFKVWLWEGEKRVNMMEMRDILLKEMK